MQLWGDTVAEIAVNCRVTEDLARLWCRVVAHRLDILHAGYIGDDDALARETRQHILFDTEIHHVVGDLRAQGSPAAWVEAVSVTGDLRLVASGLGMPLQALYDTLAAKVDDNGWLAWLEAEGRRLGINADASAPAAAPHQWTSDDDAAMEDFDFDMGAAHEFDPSADDDAATAAQGLMDMLGDQGQPPAHTENVDEVAELLMEVVDPGQAIDEYIALVWADANLEVHDLEIVNRRTGGELMAECRLAYHEAMQAGDGDEVVEELKTLLRQLHARYWKYRSEE
ncbi:hypothetical protein AB0M48_30150 [Lentzea sp. NPDC051208]|uniref:hypothetical protein n=1 Tax=Lentzea sp. NPDC051208 TaxID=3154642 RepID=UPI003421A9E8